MIYAHAASCISKPKFQTKKKGSGLSRHMLQSPLATWDKMQVAQHGQPSARPVTGLMSQTGRQFMRKASFNTGFSVEVIENDVTFFWLRFFVWVCGGGGGAAGFHDWGIGVQSQVLGTSK